MVNLFGGRVASALVAVWVLAIGSSANAEASQISPIHYNLKPPRPRSTWISPPSRWYRHRECCNDFGLTGGRSDDGGDDGQPVRSPAAARPVRDGPAERVDGAAGGLALQGRQAALRAGQKFATNAELDEQTNCLATAVYFEARGESLRVSWPLLESL